MQKRKSNWKRALLVVTALMLVVSVFAGCTSAPEKKMDITMADTQFDSLWLLNATAEYILEKGYGYNVETIETTTPIAQVSLAEGDIDIWMELWQQNWQDHYDEVTAAGKIENLGEAYEGGPQFWIIPQWVHEEYGINTVFDMIDHWELFKDPEDSEKGAFYNCIIGWQCEALNNVKFETYGLDEYYNNIAPGSSGALAAVLIGAQKKEQPIFSYYWAPTPVMGMFDWYVLEEPEYNKAVWDQITKAKDDPSLRPVSEACAYEVLPVDKGINANLRETNPDIVAMLEKMNVGLAPINKATAYAEENEIQDWSEVAVWYLEGYESTWKAWVTDDAYKKIKEALALE